MNLDELQEKLLIAERAGNKNAIRVYRALRRRAWQEAHLRSKGDVVGADWEVSVAGVDNGKVVAMKVRSRW